MSRWLCILVVITVLPTGRVAAQPSPSVGDRVRVTREDGSRVTGILSYYAADGLRLTQEKGQQELAVSAGEVQVLERSLGEYRDFGANFALVAGASALAFGIIWGATWEPCTGSGFSCLGSPQSRGAAFSFGLALGAILGVPAGILYGISEKSERWMRITPSETSRVRLTVTPRGGCRFGFAGSLALGSR